jgi:hypothetical protein
MLEKNSYQPAKEEAPESTDSHKKRGVWIAVFTVVVGLSLGDLFMFNALPDLQSFWLPIILSNIFIFFGFLIAIRRLLKNRG